MRRGLASSLTRGEGGENAGELKALLLGGAAEARHGLPEGFHDAVLAGQGAVPLRPLPHSPTHLPPGRHLSRARS
eukprot:1195960-Prorocentrum_minimum.AAC.6